MNSAPVASFWVLYRRLPAEVRQQARKAHRLWKVDPQLAGLWFKRVRAGHNIYSVRISRDYRACGQLRGDTMHWDFIGDHDAYIRYLDSL